MLINAQKMIIEKYLGSRKHLQIIVREHILCRLVISSCILLMGFNIGCSSSTSHTTRQRVEILHQTI